MLVPECLASFAACAAVVRQMARRAWRRTRGPQTPEQTAGQRMRETCMQLGWEELLGRPLEVDADEGVLRLAEDSVRCAVEVAKHGWLSRRARADATIGETLDLDARDVPTLDAHCEFAQIATAAPNSRLRLRVVLGGCAVTGLLKRRWSEDTTYMCVCGAGNPEMRHVVYECTERPDPHMAALLPRDRATTWRSPGAPLGEPQGPDQGGRERPRQRGRSGRGVGHRRRGAAGTPSFSLRLGGGPQGRAHPPQPRHAEGRRRHCGRLGRRALPRRGRGDGGGSHRHMPRRAARSHRDVRLPGRRGDLGAHAGPARFHRTHRSLPQESGGMAAA